MPHTTKYSAAMSYGCHAIPQSSTYLLIKVMSHDGQTLSRVADTTLPPAALCHRFARGFPTSCSPTSPTQPILSVYPLLHMWSNHWNAPLMVGVPTHHFYSRRALLISMMLHLLFPDHAHYWVHSSVLHFRGKCSFHPSKIYTPTPRVLYSSTMSK